MKRKRRTRLFCQLILCLASAKSLAQFEDRAEMQGHYKDYIANSDTTFAGSPLYHITPERRTISFAGAFDIYNTTIAPDGSSIIDGSVDDLDHYLELTGWTVSPLITISTRNFGIGFTSENGKRQSHYVRKASSGGSFQEHHSDLTYSGFGVFGYLIPKIRKLPSWVVPTVIVGFKSLAAEQKYMQPRYAEYEETNTVKYRYSVEKIHIGANLGIRIARKFTIIPWYDMTSVKTGKASSDNSSAPTIEATETKTSTGATTNQVSPYVALFLQDRELFWELYPEKTFGLDFAVKIWRIDIHLGGALGILAGASKGSDRVYEANYFLSASYSMKSR